MRLTKNRQVILQLLAKSAGEIAPPPHSVADLIYMLDDAIKYQWTGYDHYQLKKTPSKQQMHRTIRNLWADGLIVGTKCIDDPIGNGLPSRVIRYQLSSDVNQNYIISECQEVFKKVDKAKHGISLFSQPFDWGLSVQEVKQITAKVKTMLHKTHPDKQKGFTEQFKQMTQCMVWIRSGIPLPTDNLKTVISTNTKTLTQ